MSREVMTNGAPIFVMAAIKLPKPDAVPATLGSFVADFNHVKQGLSEKPLQRPARLRPVSAISGTEMKRLAKTNQPPPEWFEGEEERPF